MPTLKDFLNEIAALPVKDDAIVTDKTILREAIIAEYDAVNLYEQFASSTENEKIKKVMLDVAREEKEHIGEFMALLKEIDKDFEKDLEEGEEEVKELTESTKNKRHMKILTALDVEEMELNVLNKNEFKKILHSQAKKENVRTDIHASDMIERMSLKLAKETHRMLRKSLKFRNNFEPLKI